MSDLTLKVHYNLDKLRAEEEKRLMGEIITNQADSIEAGASSYLCDWFEGDVFAMARHLEIKIKAPFDEMEQKTGNGILVRTFE